MNRAWIIGISAGLAFVLFITVALSRRYRTAALTPSELAVKSVTPPAPPDMSCDTIQRAVADASTENAVRNTDPLSADEIAIYRAVIQNWNQDSRSLLNVSNKTIPLESNISDCDCLKSIDEGSITRATHSFHVLTREVVTGKSIHLVNAEAVETSDPSTSIRDGKSVETAVREAFDNGIFSVSEVAFDKERRRALVGFSFVCGSLCGSGGVWLLEKVDGVWRKSDHTCGGGWVS